MRHLGFIFDAWAATGGFEEEGDVISPLTYKKMILLCV